MRYLRNKADGQSSKDISGEWMVTLYLEQMLNEALDLEAEAEPLVALRDTEGAAALYNRIEHGLLPEALRLARGYAKRIALSHVATGVMLRILSRRDEAIEYLREANRLHTHRIGTLLELVRCLGELHRDDEALPFAREAVQVAPVDPRAWCNLAISLMWCGMRDEAKAAIDKAIALDPKDPKARYFRDNFDRFLPRK